MHNDDEKIISFLTGTYKIPREGKISDILNFSDARLESHHGYIQWCFPTTIRSKARPGSPYIHDIKEYQKDPEKFAVMQENMLAVFHRMLKFYGLAVVDNHIETTEKYKARFVQWLTPQNHNFLRLSRMLQSLCLCGMPEKAAMLYVFLERLSKSPEYESILAVPILHWTNSMCNM